MRGVTGNELIPRQGPGGLINDAVHMQTAYLCPMKRESFYPFGLSVWAGLQIGALAVMEYDDQLVLILMAQPMRGIAQVD